jgi:hypothetical protein
MQILTKVLQDGGVLRHKAPPIFPWFDPNGDDPALRTRFGPNHGC